MTIKKSLIQLAILTGLVLIQSNAWANNYILSNETPQNNYIINDQLDIDQDGENDIFVGAPQDNETGRLYIFFGDTIESDTLDLNDADITLEGEEKGDGFGAAFGLIEDEDGDNLGELFVVREADLSSEIYYTADDLNLNESTSVAVNDGETQAVRISVVASESADCSLNPTSEKKDPTTLILLSGFIGGMIIIRSLASRRQKALVKIKS